MRTQQREATEQRRDVEHAAFRVLAEARTLAEAAPRLLEGVCKALGWDFGALWILNRDDERLLLSNAWLRNGEGLAPFEKLCNEISFERGVGLPGRVWESSRVEWIRDVVVDDNFPRAATALSVGLHGALAFPIFVRSELYGVVEFFSSEVHEPDVELITMLEAVATQISAFVEWDNVERDLKFRKALLEAQSEAAIDGIVVGSPDNRILFWNNRFAEMWKIPPELLKLGLPHEAVIQHMASQSINPDAFQEVARAIVRDPDSARRDELFLADGRVFDRWTSPVRGEDGTLFGRMVTYRDITEQKKVEQALRRNEQWVSFLASVSVLLSESLDFRSALKRFADLTVPWMAEWCAIHVVGADGLISDSIVSTIEPEKKEILKEMGERYDPKPDEPAAIYDVIRSGKPALFHEYPEEFVVSRAQDDEHEAMMRKLGFRSAVIVPIIARDRVLGSLTLISTNENRLFTESDLRRAEELAARAAYPIDNARIYQQSAVVARTLQRSLLPPGLPKIPGVDLVARYVPAGQGVEVGGDFYDAFRTGRRRWGLAVGDVTGKGVEAATVTSLARHTIRAAAMSRAQPSEILRILNQALLEDQSVERFCTALYANVETRFGRVIVTFSCAGHPRPYVIRSDGRIERVDCPGTLLGFVRDVPLTDVRLELQFGDKLIFYTDGVTDARIAGRTGSEDEFAELLKQCAKRGTDAAADLITRAVIDLQEGQPRDDIAVVMLGVRSSIFRTGRRTAGRDE